METSRNDRELLLFFETESVMKWLFKLIVLFSPFISIGVQSQSLVVTSLPVVLFQTNGGVHNITAGSVIQLYCSVQSTSASFSWTKDGRSVVIDIPHLRERTCNDSTIAMSVLTVDNFQSSDGGTYQCMSVDGNITGQGDSVELRVVISASLVVAHHPIDPDTFQDNRTGILSGSTVTIKCAADYKGTSTNNYTQILWIRDGNVVIEDSDHSISVIDLNSTFQIANFDQDDAGVYQCIFIAENELMTTIPYKLQTDILSPAGINSIYLERISPKVIFIRPPEKLVIEFKATGRYRNILWQKNSVTQIIEPRQFPNFNEILVYSTTTQADLGLYEITSVGLNPLLQRVVPSELDFYVISPVDVNTTITNGSDISVREGNSISISCISTGAPTPSIFWTLDGQSVPFNSTEIVTGGQIMLVRSDPNDPNSPLIPGGLSKITSNLLSINVQYPDHDGVYTCTGSNDISTINISSAIVNMQIIVPPEVEVITSSSQVILGGSTTLFCNVTRTNPEIAGVYNWTKENTGERILESFNRLLLNLSAVSDFGAYSCTVTNRAGEVGRGNVTIIRQEVITTESFLQLRMSPVDNCVSWTEQNHDQKQADIIAHIISIVIRACSCGFSESNIIESVFSCRSSETQVVFKARLSYTSEIGTYSANDLVTIISSWVSSGSSITVTGTVFSVDSTCPTKVESLTDEDCVTPDLSDILNINIIWSSALGGGIVAVVIITIIIIVTISLLLYARQRKKLVLSSSHELQPQSNVTEESAAPPVLYETVPMSGEGSSYHNPTVEPNIAYAGVQISAMEPNIAYKTFGSKQQKSSESVDPNTYTFQRVGHDEEEQVHN